jgi:hypothetical protein
MKLTGVKLKYMCRCRALRVGCGPNGSSGGSAGGGADGTCCPTAKPTPLRLRGVKAEGVRGVSCAANFSSFAGLSTARIAVCEKHARDLSRAVRCSSKKEIDTKQFNAQQGYITGYITMNMLLFPPSSRELSILWCMDRQCSCQQLSHIVSVILLQHVAAQEACATHKRCWFPPVWLCLGILWSFVTEWCFRVRVRRQAYSGVSLLSGSFRRRLDEFQAFQ